MSRIASKLMSMCTERIYIDNLFHILRINSNTTPRKLRRRREDLDTANEFGRASWEQEFEHLMGACEIPTYQKICEAFDQLEDPETRVVSDFFWFWPLDENDISIDLLLSGNTTDAIRIWEQGEYTYGKTRIISIHNLAVMYHLYAIDAELQFIEVSDASLDSAHLNGDAYAKMCEYWDKAIEYWEYLADNDDFWELFAKRVQALDDPRLTKDFVRKFRLEFPIAFDNINAKIVEKYAKKEAYTDAKRHLNYMLKTMSGLDDVQSSLNILFEPMENKVKRLIDNFNTKVKNSPQQGIIYAKSLLNETEEICKIAVGLFSEGHKIRTGLLSEIAQACNYYLVQYGNTTEDWQSCLALLEKIWVFACTPEVKEILKTNINTISENINLKKLKETCWFCKTNKADQNYEVKMYGDVVRTWGKVMWQHGSVNIPICSACSQKAKTKQQDAISFGILAGISSVIMLAIIAPSLIPLWIFASFIFGYIIVKFILFFSEGILESQYRDFPQVKKLLEEGWNFGNRPPNA